VTEIDKLKFAVGVFARLSGANIYFDKKNDCYLLVAPSKMKQDQMLVTSSGHGTGQNPDVTEIYYLLARIMDNEELFWSNDPTKEKPVFIGTPEEVLEYAAKHAPVDAEPKV